MGMVPVHLWGRWCTQGDPALAAWAPTGPTLPDSLG